MKRFVSLWSSTLSGVTPRRKSRTRTTCGDDGGASRGLAAGGTDNPDLEVYRLLSQAYEDSSVVGLIPTRSSVIVFVGVLGIYVGLVNVPADTSEFPLDGTHDLGHVMALRDGKIERQSLRDAARMLDRMLKNGWRPTHACPAHLRPQSDGE